MKDKNKLILALTSLFLLTGCGPGPNDEIPILETKQEISEGIEITKVFESGTHIVKYIEVCNITKYGATYTPFTANGYNNIGIEVPDGYELVEIEPWNKNFAGDTVTGGFVYFFVNTEEVEVSGTLDTVTNEEYYPNPGIPLDKKLSLK